MTEQEYEAVLARISDLMDAEVGTPEGAELLALSLVAEVYEERHFPMTSSVPSDMRGPATSEPSSPTARGGE